MASQLLWGAAVMANRNVSLQPSPRMSGVLDGYAVNLVGDTLSITSVSPLPRGGRLTLDLAGERALSVDVWQGLSAANVAARIAAAINGVPGYWAHAGRLPGVSDGATVVMRSADVPPPPPSSPRGGVVVGRGVVHRGPVVSSSRPAAPAPADAKDAGSPASPRGHRPPYR